MTAKYLPPAKNSGRKLLRNRLDPRRRILVAEDEKNLRQSTAELLMDAGYQVDAAENGADAWAAIQLEAYDLLITGQFMPKLSGVRLIKKIHDARMTLPVILTTGFLPTWEFSHHTWLQPVRMLLRPYAFGRLLDTVQNMLPRNVGNDMPLPPLPPEPPLPPMFS